MLQNFDILKQPDHWFEISQKQKLLFIIICILVKKENYEKALTLLKNNGYTVI